MPRELVELRRSMEGREEGSAVRSSLWLPAYVERSARALCTGELLQPRIKSVIAGNGECQLRR
jgi:hypothetical protein